MPMLNQRATTCTRTALLGAAMLLAVSGCTGSLGATPDVHPIAATATTAAVQDQNPTEISPEAFVDILERNRKATKSLHARMEVSGEFSYTAEVLVNDPDVFTHVLARHEAHGGVYEFIHLPDGAMYGRGGTLHKEKYQLVFPEPAPVSDSAEQYALQAARAAFRATFASMAASFHQINAPKKPLSVRHDGIEHLDGAVVHRYVVVSHKVGDNPEPHSEYLIDNAQVIRKVTHNQHVTIGNDTERTLTVITPSKDPAQIPEPNL